MENELGKRIKQAMALRGWKQTDLSTATDISQSQISRIINGERGTDLDHIKSIAYALGESPVEYVLLYANLTIERKHDSRMTRVEDILSGYSETELEMAERVIQAIRPIRPGKPGKVKDGK